MVVVVVIRHNTDSTMTPTPFLGKSQGTYFVGYYVKPWTRCPPYIIGCSLAIVWWFYFRGTTAQGFLPNRLGDSGRKARVFVWSMFAVAIGLFGVTVFGAIGAYANTPPTW